MKTILAAITVFSMSAFAQESSAPAAPTPVAADQKVQQDRKDLKEAKKEVRKKKHQLRKDMRERHEEKQENKAQ